MLAIYPFAAPSAQEFGVNPLIGFFCFCFLIWFGSGAVLLGTLYFASLVSGVGMSTGRLSFAVLFL